MELWNYTSLKTQDTKIYDIGGYKITGGLSIEFTKIVGPALLVFIALGWGLGAIFGISFWNFLSPHFKLWWTLIWIGTGIGVGCALWYIQFAGYRLYQYLGAYFKPKKVYMNDWKHTEVTLTNIQIKGLVKHLL